MDSKVDAQIGMYTYSRAQIKKNCNKTVTSHQINCDSLYAILSFFSIRSLIVHTVILASRRKLGKKVAHIVFAADKLETFIIYTVRTKYLYCKHLVPVLFFLWLSHKAHWLSFILLFLDGKSIETMCIYVRLGHRTEIAHKHTNVKVEYGEWVHSA